MITKKNFNELKEISEQTYSLLKETLEALKKDQTKLIEENKLLKSLLKEVHLSVKSATTIDDVLLIRYDISPVYLHFDEKGEPIENETLKAINMLNLVSLQDQIELGEKIKSFKK